ncbi:MAG: cytochrome b/b6 domain-containing protein [Bacillota bacterium]|nr:cytochrome b/b6 domain-containing protein [Bacillota bacterium]MDW7682504.1 cytochrome b/b6 domain-containing protein [Bacillota bacterium]
MQNNIRQPWEIRLFHWLIFVVIMLKFWSGFYISYPHPLWGFSGMYGARMLHATMTPVLAALLAFRIYYAIVSGDWREVIAWRRSDFRQIRPWLRTFLFLQDTPLRVQNKYEIGQRLLFMAVFLTMPVFYTTGVILLNFPFFRWLNVFYGGQGISRIAHFLASVFLAAFVAFHIYLALSLSVDRLKAMFTGRIPVPSAKERSIQDESDSPGGNGKPGHVR